MGQQWPILYYVNHPMMQPIGQMKIAMARTIVSPSNPVEFHTALIFITQPAAIAAMNIAINETQTHANVSPSEEKNPLRP